jgi:ribA/ribD-fused uncharacterized protein
MQTPPEDLDALRARIRGGSQPDFVHFWHAKPGARGVIGPKCLSQWYPAAFTFQGEKFATAEHYMMWSKAHLFGDDGAAASILAARTPASAKTIGRTVKGFDEETWEEHRMEIVVRGNLAKFAQNPKLRKYLLGTDPDVLVEASPDDRVWGIGLAESDDGAHDPAAWPGLNLLGFALMQVRYELALVGRAR